MKTWNDAFSNFDVEAIRYWLGLGIKTFEGLDCKVEDPYSYPKRRVAPIFRCWKELSRWQRSVDYLAKVFEVFKLFVELGVSIQFLDPTKSTFLFDCIKKTCTIQYEHEKEPSEKNKLAFELVKFLIKKNPTWLNISDSDGNTALHTALAGSHVELASYLIEQGANKNDANNKGDVPLHIACRIPRHIRVYSLYGSSSIEIHEKTLSEKSKNLWRELVLSLLQGGGSRKLTTFT